MTAMPTERRLGLTVRGWVVVIGVVVAAFLELAPRLGLIDSFSVKPLSEMVVALGGLLGQGTFWSEALVPSLAAIGLAFILAVVVGVVAGVILWEFRAARRIVEPWLTIYYAIPTFALYPLMVAIFGVGLGPIVLLGALFAVVVVVTSTLSGLDAAPRVVLRLGESLQLSRFQRTTKILLPAARPHILTGLRLSLSYAVIGVLASEFVLSTAGLGHFISRSYNDFEYTEMYAGVLLVLLLATAVNVVLGALATKQNRATG